ncbi:hypothetical protein ACJ5H2_07050 [Nocardioides sp. R1-1]
MVLIVLIAVLVMVGATLWWMRELRHKRVIESPDDTVREAQHREG